ncbi:glucokinase [Caloranaerobacter sp. TR13]|uniref:ROK family protein n=1 Tax=Caloranaerobacter sp. TR13 TaxID=1302151 RepID=UPI0006D47EB2|nr:ROK family protein [Caloranaerobacter sp. TR13]KPU26959.1 glucokinase [Caloranaerobacter sp. TR13]
MYIGIDIGGTAIKAGIVDKNGDIVYKKQIDTKAKRGYLEVEKDIIELIKGLINIAEDKGNKVKSIGIGVPGVADPEGNKVIYCPNLGWANVPLGENLKKEFEFPIYIENDATVAGIAESIKGVTKGYENSIFITLGTGVGGGIILSGKVYSGAHGIGSEIGHMIVGENFYDCNCGNNGCLETFSSATAIIKYAKKLIKEGQYETTLMKKVNDDLMKLNSKIIFDSAKEGDQLANEVVDRMVKYLGIGIANLINILDPDVVAIGGGVSKAGIFLLEKIKREVSKYVLYKEAKHAEIFLAELGNDAGIIGAALLSEYK